MPVCFTGCLSDTLFEALVNSLSTLKLLSMTHLPCF